MYECICAYTSVYVKNRISDQVHLTVSRNRTNRIQWDYPKTHLVVFRSWIINIYIKINIKICVFWICSTGNGDNGLWGGWMTINKLKIQLITNSSGFRVGLAGASLKVALTPQMHQELHWECIGTSVLMLMHPKIQMKNAKIQKNIAKGTTEPGINYFNRINNWKSQTISFTSHKPNSHRSDCKWRNLGQTSAWFGLAEGKNICNNWQIHVSTWRNLCHHFEKSRPNFNFVSTRSSVSELMNPGLIKMW